jgi:hypothetical protein
VEYFAVFDNPDFRVGPMPMRALRSAQIVDVGNDHLVGLPGHGLISLLASNADDKYPRGTGVDAIDGEGEGITKQFRTAPHYFAAGNTHHVTEINSDPALESIEHNIQLHVGSELGGTLLDPNGKPLGGALCAGLATQFLWTALDNEQFAVRHLRPGQKRRLYFYHEARKLAGSVETSGDETGSLLVKLEPAGAFKGRLLLENGDAADGLEVSRTSLRQAAVLPRGIIPIQGRTVTDADGRFEITGLAPGLNYSLKATRSGTIVGAVIENETVAPGETKDLGNRTIVDFDN